ncbi:DUF3948 family protein [Bacillus cereus group sp. BfR-BA-01379]
MKEQVLQVTKGDFVG